VDPQFGPHILVASNTKNFKEFRKRVDEVGQNGKTFYMDVWSKDELQMISAYHIDILNLRYDVFGGSARNFKLERQPASTNSEQFSEIVDSMINLFFTGRSYSVQESDWKASLISIKTAIVEQLKSVSDDACDNAQSFTSMFYHHRNSKHDWASTFLKCLAGKMISLSVLNLRERLRILIRDSGMGCIFESLGHETLIHSNTNYVPRSIIKKQLPRKFELKIPNRVEVFRQISDICHLSSECYGLPVNANFPCVDVVIQPNILLQFTTSTTHPGREVQFSDIRGKLKAEETRHRLVFVVPKELLNKYPAQQGYGDIKQYVMTYPAFHDEMSGERA
jgi:hypothetical protein